MSKQAAPAAAWVPPPYDTLATLKAGDVLVREARGINKHAPYSGDGWVPDHIATLGSVTTYRVEQINYAPGIAVPFTKRRLGARVVVLTDDGNGATFPVGTQLDLPAETVRRMYIQAAPKP